MVGWKKWTVWGITSAVTAAVTPNPAAAIFKDLPSNGAAAGVEVAAAGATIEISHLAFCVAQVECFTGNELIARATGFFYASAGDIYLITNRHVVRSEETGHLPDKLKLRLHTDASDIRRNDVHVVRLYDRRGRRTWLEHPTADVDVVAVPLDTRRLQAHFVVRPFGPSNHLPEEVVVQVGEDVLVFGYPLGLYDVAYNLPLVRRGTLASFYPIPFGGRPYFLMECRLHRGCSGSPVLTKVGGLFQTRSANPEMFLSQGFYLLGVSSARVEKRREGEGEEPLGLNEVWFAYLIPEIIAAGKVE
jgi:S1-C subfamily serine protease